MTPENSLVIDAVASAIPSTNPMVTMLAPSTDVMKIGSRLCTSSDDASMSSEPKPSAQMPAGNARRLLDDDGNPTGEFGDGHGPAPAVNIGIDKAWLETEGAYSHETEDMRN